MIMSGPVAILRPAAGHTGATGAPAMTKRLRAVCLGTGRGDPARRPSPGMGTNPCVSRVVVLSARCQVLNAGGNQQERRAATSRCSACRYNDQCQIQQPRAKTAERKNPEPEVAVVEVNTNEPFA